MASGMVITTPNNWSNQTGQLAASRLSNGGANSGYCGNTRVLRLT
jgi:hypothetical protein